MSSYSKGRAGAAGGDGGISRLHAICIVAGRCVNWHSTPSLQADASVGTAFTRGTRPIYPTHTAHRQARCTPKSRAAPAIGAGRCMQLAHHSHYFYAIRRAERPKGKGRKTKKAEQQKGPGKGGKAHHLHTPCVQRMSSQVPGQQSVSAWHPLAPSALHLHPR